MQLLFSVISFLLWSTFSAAAQQKCYGLDGTELDSTFGPCNPDAKHSGCCAVNRPAGSVDICLDNGLCMATNDKYMGTTWQNGCTDPTGRDEGCPKLCPDVRDNFGGQNKVEAWNIQMCDYGSYCCRAAGDRNNCCNNATAPKVTTTYLGAFQFQTSTAGLPSTTAVVATATPTDPSVVATAVSTGEPFSQSTATPLPRPDEICKKDKSAVVGGAVGGTLSAIILGLVGMMWWMYKKERRQRRLKEHYETQFGQNWAYRRTIVVETDSVPVSRDEVREALGTSSSDKTAVVTEGDDGDKKAKEGV